MKPWNLSQHQFRNVVNVKDYGAKGDNVTDDTAAIQAAFDYATILGKTVYLPAGNYIVGNLLFGNQSATSQSNAPYGLIGDDRANTQLVAKPGLTGTLLKSWSLAGALLRDFGIDTTNSTAAAWDCRWGPGGAPSTQNTIENILVSVHNAFTDGVTAHVNMDWLNDTFPRGITVRSVIDDNSYRNCQFSFIQSGGLASFSQVICSGGYIRLGCQNGNFDTCWSMGVEFAAACLNIISMNGWYPYPNLYKRSCFWTENFDTYQGVRALTAVGSQFISIGLDQPGDAYFDMGLYSQMKFIGCEFIGDATKLMSDRSRSDSYAQARVVLDGGHDMNNLVLADVPPGPLTNSGGGIVVLAKNFMKDSTAKMVTKDWVGTSVPTLFGTTDAGTYTPIDMRCSWTRGQAENYVEAQIDVQWADFTGTGGLRIYHHIPFPQNGVGWALVSLQTIGAVPLSALIGGGYIDLTHAGDAAVAACVPAGRIILSLKYFCDA